MDTFWKDEMVETLSLMLFARKQLPVDKGRTLPPDSLRGCGWVFSGAKELLQGPRGKKF